MANEDRIALLQEIRDAFADLGDTQMVEKFHGAMMAAQARADGSLAVAAPRVAQQISRILARSNRPMMARGKPGARAELVPQKKDESTSTRGGDMIVVKPTTDKPETK